MNEKTVVKYHILYISISVFILYIYIQWINIYIVLRAQAPASPQDLENIEPARPGPGTNQTGASGQAGGTYRLQSPKRRQGLFRLRGYDDW
jgi:hypothetical protein